MRNVFRVLAVAVLVTAFAGAAIAQPPLDGTYKSTLGEMLEGTSTHSWNGVGGHADPVVGHVLNGASLTGGGVLGTEWQIVCPTIASVTVLYEVPGFQKAVLIQYIGGYIVLDGSGPWGGGDPSYIGTINSYVETRTMQLSGGYGAVENHSVEASIQGYSSDCVSFGIGNGAWFGDTDGGAKPATYPAFLDGSCDPLGTTGRWGSLDDITLTVTGCAVSVEDQTWGAVKQRYNN
jgi:hypothetical protein